MNETKAAYEAQIIETNRLGTAMAQMGPPTRETAAAFDQSKTDSIRLKAEYLALAEATTSLNRIMRQKPTDALGLAKQQADAAEATKKLGTVLKQIKENADEVTTSNAKMAASWEKAASSASGTRSALSGTTEEQRRLNNELDKFYSSGRQSLGLFERIRGQLLAMTAAYVGVFGVVEGLKGIVNAVSTVEAANSRMLATFGNEAKAATELDFVRRTADRLKVSFGELSKEYSTFAAGTNGTVLAGQKTRDIFVQTAEAARVLGLSTEDFGGVLKALTQIASKGKVSLEELSGQLGDRLPGALQIMADGLGITTKELLKMTKEGSLGLEGLVAFGDRLSEIYGPALAQSLTKTAATFGGFKNAIFQAAVQIGKAGFVDSLNDLITSLTEKLQSSEAASFFERLGVALGAAADFASFAADNFDTILAVLLSIAATRAIPIFTNLAESIGGANGFLSTFAKNFVTAKAAMEASTAATVTATATNESFGASLLALGPAFTATIASIRATALAIVTNIGGAVTRMITLLRTLPAIIVSSISSFSLASTATTVWTGAVGALSGAFVALRAAITAAIASTGIGLIIVGLTFAFTEWLTSVDKTTEALTENAKVIDQAKNAYDQAKRSGTSWAEELRKAGITVLQVQDAILKAADAATEKFQIMQETLQGGIFDKVRFKAEAFLDPSIEKTKTQLEVLTETYRKLNITQRDYSRVLDQIGASTDNEYIKEKIKDLQRQSLATEEARKATGDLESILKGLQGTTEEQTKAGDDLTNTTADMNEKLRDSAEAATAGKAALEELTKAIPALREQMEALQKLKDLDLAYEKAKLGVMGDQRELARITDIYRLAQGSVLVQTDKELKAALDRADNGVDAAAALIRKREGFIDTAKFDVNHQRVGYGSDTKTDAAGNVSEVQAGDTVTRVDAERDLARRLGEFQGAIERAVGSGAFQAMTPKQQAALTSVAYNYGSLPDSIVKAVKTGNSDAIVKAIQDLQGDNGGVNRERRLQEAAIFSEGSSPGALQSTAEDEEKAAAAALKKEQADKIKADRYREERAAELARDKDREANAGVLSREATIQYELAKDQAAAEAAGVTLSQQEIDQKRELVGLEYDRVNAKRQGKEETKQDQAAVNAATAKLAEANALYEKQSALVKEIVEAKRSGNDAAIPGLTSQLEETRAKLTEVIAEAQGMWAAIGGEAAVTAGVKIDTINSKLATTASRGAEVKTGWEGVDDMFASGLTSAAASFAQAIGEGKSASEAARDAFGKFAADFLMQIAQMILKSLILNTLQAAFGGGSGASGGGLGGFFASVLGNINHDGGMAGASGRTRAVSPGWFAGAERFHEGGLPGLKRDEVASILQKGEEILAKDDPRNVLNGGGRGDGAAPAGAPTNNFRVVNAIDAGSFMEAGLNSAVGETTFLNFIRANSSTINGLLGTTG